jgi:hypothetical protein
VPASLFYLAPLAPDAAIEAGPAGMHSGLYQQMLREISALVVSFTAVVLERSFRGAGSASSDSLDNLTHRARRGRIASVDEST